jgi:hypothetical protein
MSAVFHSGRDGQAAEPSFQLELWELKRFRLLGIYALLLDTEPRLGW